MTNYPGNYQLCMSYKGQVGHYYILYQTSQLSFHEEVPSEKLMLLVEHYASKDRLYQPYPAKDHGGHSGS